MMRREEKRHLRLHGHALTAFKWFMVCLAPVLVMMSAGCRGGQSAETVRVKELPDYLGQAVTVKGRTGQILEGYPVPAFTLRDDYGDVVIVMMQSNKPYPIMGATYYVTGVSKQVEDKIVLSEATYRRWYGWLTLPAAVILAIVVIGLCVTYLVSRWHISRRTEAIREEVFAEPWGFVEVVAGRFDEGKRFALRYDEIPIGREADPSIGVLLVDPAISRAHGRIIKDSSGRVFYEDVGSRYGSWVNEVQVQPNQRVHLPEMALIRLGPETIIRISSRMTSLRETYLAEQGQMRTGQPEGDIRPTVARGEQNQAPREGESGGEPSQPEGDNRPTVRR